MNFSHLQILIFLNKYNQINKPPILSCQLYQFIIIIKDFFFHIDKYHVTTHVSFSVEMSLNFLFYFLIHNNTENIITKIIIILLGL